MKGRLKSSLPSFLFSVGGHCSAEAGAGQETLRLRSHHLSWRELSGGAGAFAGARGACLTIPISPSKITDA